MNGYAWLKENLKDLFNLGATIRVIGRSVLGRKIYAIVIGEGAPVVLQYGIHAREYAACTLAILHAKMLIKKRPNNICFVLVPMANPDGTEIALCGKIACAKRAAWIAESFSEQEILLWKANARGVDINNNFDAKHGCHAAANVPSSHGYPGTQPESEPETRALVKLVNSLRPVFSASFHTKGQEIYYDFFQSDPKLRRDKKIARMFARNFGYKIKSTQKISSGGFKDWCVEKCGIPSLTVELASDKLKHPIGCDHAKELLKRTKDLGRLCAKTIKKIKKTGAT